MFEFLLDGCFILDTLSFPLFLLLLQIIDLLLQDFDVQLELLLDFNVVSDFCLVILQLRLVLFWGQINRVER